MPDVLVVGEARLSQEFRRVRDARYSRDDAYRSPLLDVDWLRCVVDEGQHRGLAQASNRHLLLDELRADRVWLMTGMEPARNDRFGSFLDETNSLGLASTRVGQTPAN